MEGRCAPGLLFRRGTRATITTLGMVFRIAARFLWASSSESKNPGVDGQPTAHRPIEKREILAINRKDQNRVVAIGRVSHLLQ